MVFNFFRDLTTPLRPSRTTLTEDLPHSIVSVMLMGCCVLCTALEVRRVGHLNVRTRICRDKGYDPKWGITEAPKKNHGWEEVLIKGSKSKKQLSGAEKRGGITPANVFKIRMHA